MNPALKTYILKFCLLSYNVKLNLFVQTLKQNTEPVPEDSVSADEPRKKESATQTPGRSVKSSKAQQESTTPTQAQVSYEWSTMIYI